MGYHWLRYYAGPEKLPIPEDMTEADVEALVALWKEHNAVLVDAWGRVSRG